MASSTFTQASYESVILSSIDSTTGAKTVTVQDVLSVFSTGDVAVINLGSDNEEWFEVTDIDTSALTITFTLRGLSLVSTATLSEVAANRSAHGPGETIAIVTFPNKIHTQNTDTGTDSTTFDINNDGSGVILDATGVTADRTFTFPDESDEVAGIAATQTFTNKKLTSAVLTTPQIDDTSADHQYVFAVSELAADRTVTMPLLLGNDTFVFADFIQTLTQKTLTAPTITGAAITTSTLTSPVINTGVTGTGISSSVSAPGSATILATTKGVVDYLSAISPGVTSISSNAGTDRVDNIDLVDGTYISVTDNGDATFTFDNDTDQLFLFNEIFA